MSNVESIIFSKDNKARGAKFRLPKINVLERPINMLHAIEATEINSTNKSYDPLEKDKKPQINFVVNTNDFCFHKTVFKMAMLVNRM